MANPPSPRWRQWCQRKLLSGISGGNTAIRKSVAKTAKGYGSAVAASAVYSETPALRFAYSGVECDAHRLIDRS